MADLIERSAALAVVAAYDYRGMTVEQVKTITDGCCDELSKLHSIDAAPVRHGAWSEHFKRPCSIMFDCSECGGIAYDVQKNKKQPKRCTYRYCPNCGAKMNGGDT